MQNFPIILTYSFMFLVILGALLFLFIFSRRMVLKRLEFRRRELSAAIERDILEALSSRTPQKAREVASKYRKHPHILIKILIEFAERIKGPERIPLKLIYNWALRAKVVKNLHSRFSFRRFGAVQPLILFLNQRDTQEVIKLLHDKPAIRLAVIHTLSRMPHEFLLRYIYQAFEQDPDPDMHAYLDAMFSLGQKNEKLIRTYLKKVILPSKKALLIELAGSIPIPELYREIVSIADHPEKEIRIRAARALGALNRPSQEVIQALRRLAMDGAWEVQAQAIKSIGKLKIINALDLLTEALFSPHWYCRLNAAVALTQLRPEGIKRLKKIASQKKDRYASEMAQMILADTIIIGENP